MTCGSNMHIELIHWCIYKQRFFFLKFMLLCILLSTNSFCLINWTYSKSVFQPILLCYCVLAHKPSALTLYNSELSTWYCNCLSCPYLKKIPFYPLRNPFVWSNDAFFGSVIIFHQNSGCVQRNYFMWYSSCLTKV